MKLFKLNNKVAEANFRAELSLKDWLKVSTNWVIEDIVEGELLNREINNLPSLGSYSKTTKYVIENTKIILNAEHNEEGSIVVTYFYSFWDGQSWSSDSNWSHCGDDESTLKDMVECFNSKTLAINSKTGMCQDDSSVDSEEKYCSLFVEICNYDNSPVKSLIEEIGQDIKILQSKKEVLSEKYNATNPFEVDFYKVCNDIDSCAMQTVESKLEYLHETKDSLYSAILKMTESYICQSSVD